MKVNISHGSACILMCILCSVHSTYGDTYVDLYILLTGGGDIIILFMRLLHQYSSLLRGYNFNMPSQK
jgi:hypothetical protein